MSTCPKTGCSSPSGSGAALPKGHFRPGQSALLLCGESGRGHAPPAAPALRTVAGLPGGRLPAARQRLQFPTGAAGAQRPAGGPGEVRDGTFPPHGPGAVKQHTRGITAFIVG